MAAAAAAAAAAATAQLGHRSSALTWPIFTHFGSELFELRVAKAEHKLGARLASSWRPALT